MLRKSLQIRYSISETGGQAIASEVSALLAGKYVVLNVLGGNFQAIPRSNNLHD
jgi:hypothetical protein